MNLFEIVESILFLLIVISFTSIFGLLLGVVLWLVSLPFLAVSGYQEFYVAAANRIRSSEGKGPFATAAVGCLAVSLVSGVVYALVGLAALAAYLYSPFASETLLWLAPIILATVWVVAALLYVRSSHSRWDSVRRWGDYRLRDSSAFVAAGAVKWVALVVANYAILFVIAAAQMPP